MKEKFKVGDKVRHRASWQLGIVTKIYRETEEIELDIGFNEDKILVEHYLLEYPELP